MKLPQVGDAIFDRLEHDTSDYLVGGERVVSVTEALRIAGLVDYSGVSQEALLKGAQRGTLVHAITAQMDGSSGGSFGGPSECEPFVEAYLQFKADTGFEPKLIEQLLVHDKWRYAGRLDRFGYVSDKPSIVDLKTGNSVPTWVALQLVAYEMALSDADLDGSVNAPGPYRRYALRLQDNGRYFLHRYTDASDRADWLAALRVAQWQLLKGNWSLE